LFEQKHSAPGENDTRWQFDPARGKSRTRSRFKLNRINTIKRRSDLIDKCNQDAMI